MPKSRVRKKPGRRQEVPPATSLAGRLLRGARIDLGDVVLSTDVEASYAEEVELVKWALGLNVPGSLGFDPFATLRSVDAELDGLVEEIDDWIRVGNHIHVKTTVSKVIAFERLMRTDHSATWDEMPADWARRTARVVTDLRDSLDRLVHDLVTRAAPGPMSERDLRKLAFPVDEPANPLTLAELRRNLPHLQDATIQAILGVQPSRCGHEHQRSWLWLLNKLNNLGKHRTVNVTGSSIVLERGPQSVAFGEGEILIPAEDLLGEPCYDGCMLDAMVAYGAPGATRFAHDDGTFEPIIGLCRLLRESFALVGGITAELLDTEGIAEEWERAEQGAGTP